VPASTPNLVQTLDDLHGRGVSVLALNGPSFDLSTSNGKLMRTIMAGIAEFERDQIRERVKSGLAAAKANGKKLGRQAGQRLSYRLIARNVGTR
jgi:putative DNA-invertase from lambdoid prophage Rac